MVADGLRWSEMVNSESSERDGSSYGSVSDSLLGSLLDSLFESLLDSLSDGR